MKTALTVLTTVFLASAGHAEDYELAQSTVRIGQTARLGRVHVTPIKVISDSRCPMNARCIWAGEVRIKARLRFGGQVVMRELVSAKPIQFAGGNVTLADVMPPRHTGHGLVPKDYRFTFTFGNGT